MLPKRRGDRGASHSDWDLGLTADHLETSAADADLFSPDDVDTSPAPHTGTMGGVSNISISAGTTSSSVGSTATMGRRALRHSIRHHAAILQHSNMAKIDINDPTETNAPRSPQRLQHRALSDPLDDEAIVGSDWNFFTPPTIPADWSQHIIRSLPKLSRKWVLLLTFITFAGSISLAIIFGASKAGFRAQPPPTQGLKETIGQAIASVSGVLARPSETTLQLQAANIVLPTAIEHNLADIDGDRGHDVQSRGIPFYLFFPQTGGLTLQHLTRQCLGLVEASDAGSVHNAEMSLIVHETQDGFRYVNIDTTTAVGLQRARQFRLASSGIVGVVYSPFLQQPSSMIFDHDNKGRLFTLVRHPVSRAIAVYEQRQKDDPNLAGMSLESFVQSGRIENNYVTRVLVNKVQGALTYDDLDMALEILRRKCFIGLSEDLAESVKRFGRYFGWPDYNVAKSDCLTRTLDADMTENQNQNTVAEGSELWKSILLQNDFDLKVYEYSKELYLEQWSLVQ